MVINRFKVYFTLLFPTTCFGSLCRSHLQAEVLFTEEGENAIDNIVINCEIPLCISEVFKNIRIKIK